MNITKINVKNFLCHKDTVLDVEDGLMGVVGPNGSGKSSLVIDSVTWSLFGKHRGSGGGDELISHGAKGCSVSIELSVEGNFYKVTRERRNKQTKLTFVDLGQPGEDSNDITKATVTLTQELIERTIGMTYEVFKNSCCIEQGGVSNFSRLSPSEASSVLYDILQLGKYTDYKDIATDKLLKCKSEHAEKYRELEDLKTKLDSVNNWSDLVEFEEKELKTLRSNLDKLKKKYKKSFDAKSNLESKHRDKQSYLLKLKNTLDTVNKDYIRTKRRLEMIKSNGGKCFFCDSELSTHKSDSIILDLKNSMDKFSMDAMNISSRIDSTESSMRSLYDQIKSISITNIENQIESIKSKIISKESRMDTTKTFGLQDTSKDDLIKNIKSLEKEVEKLNREMSLYDDLRSAFHYKGIPLDIIDNSLKELIVLVNDNLRLLSNLPIYIDIVTKRESTTGNSIDTLKIKILEGLVEKSYTSYSGGEKALIDLSIRLGLSELLARRNNFRVETLLIDEGLSALDSENQTLFLDTLIKLTSKFSKIIVITHTEAKHRIKNVKKLKK